MTDRTDLFDQRASAPPESAPSADDLVWADDPAPTLRRDRVADVGTESESDPDPGLDGDIDRGPWLIERAGRRLVDPLQRWLTRPWTAERIVRLLVTTLLVGGSTLIISQIVHPSLLVKDNTPTGGDMGAHVWGPAYLRDHLLPKGLLSGWSMDWYAGMPVYRFYMVVPALMIVALNVVLPYGIAFKLVVVAGLLTLPLCCWAFGRLARFVYPVPELMAVAGFLFLVNESFSIYGGNVKSTMAGEFSFSIALSFAVLGLGFLARGLHDGKHRGLAACLIALAAVSHGIVLIFVFAAAIFMALIWIDRQRALHSLFVIAVAALLSMFWVGPFLLNHAYMTDMKYGGRPDGAGDSFWEMYFDQPPMFDVIINGLALVGFAASIVRRQLTGAWLGIMCVVLMIGVWITRDSLPVIGLLWNPRLLPFLYLVRYLLMMVGAVELVRFVVSAGANARYVRAARRARTVAGGSLPPPLPRRGRWWIAGTATAAVMTLGVLIVEGMHFEQMPGGRYTQYKGQTKYAWGPIVKTGTNAHAASDGWTRYNFLGYEGRPYYAEYRALVLTMQQLGLDPAHGCGRATWENNEANGNYGTTMALMLLPHWTDGCIGSMEGLFFEASGTTPYHFITAAAVSKSSSNPVREIRYDNNDGAKGVHYLQSLGVKYLMVFTEDAVREAAEQPELVEVATSGPWHVYQVQDSDLVVPLVTRPVVVNGRGGDQRERWLEVGTSYFQHAEDWAAVPVADGPDDWQRLDAAVDLSRREGEPGDRNRKVDIVVPGSPIDAVGLPEVTVSNTVMTQDGVSFDVDQVGVPVLVKVSYFPNWKVSGADGPYRAAPNFMVVVPTATHVELRYDARTLTDWIAYALTLLGVGLLLLSWRRGPSRFDLPAPADDEPGDDSALAGSMVLWAAPPADAADAAVVDTGDPFDPVDPGDRVDAVVRVVPGAPVDPVDRPEPPAVRPDEAR